MIRKPISQFNSDKAFSNANVTKKVYIFSHTILNILSNFISHEYIMCDDRDPPWFNRKIKHLIQEKTMPISYIEIIKSMLVLEID